MTSRFPSLRSTPKCRHLAVLMLLALPAATSRSRANEPEATPPAPPVSAENAAQKTAVETKTPAIAVEEPPVSAPAPAESSPALAPEASSSGSKSDAAKSESVPPAPAPATASSSSPDASPLVAPESASTPAHASASVPAPVPVSAPALTTANPALPPAAATSPAAVAVAPAPAPKHHSRAVAPATLSAREGQGLVNLGHSLTERGDYDAAEIAYRQVLDGHAPLEPTKSALLGLAHMHRKQGYLTKAAAIYEKYLKDYPDDERVPDALLDLGRTLRDMGAPRLAIARFYNVINSTLKLSSNAGFEHYQLLAKTAQFEVAETHFQSGDFAEATKFYSRLRMLDLAPVDRARAHFKSAYALQLSGDFEGAITSLRAYLEQWPEDENVPEARYLLATSLRALKRTQEALTATIELLSAQKTRTANDPKRWSYWQRRTGNQLANDFFQAGDIHNALLIYQGLAALSEDPAWRTPVTYQVALCYERLGDSDHASQTYRAIVDSVGATPAPEIAEIARMAKSRLAHVDWREATDRQVATLFDFTTGQAKPPVPKSTAANDSNRSPAPASPAL